VFAAAQPSTVLADPIKTWSFGVEKSLGTGYTDFRVTRKVLSGVVLVSCPGYPVYATMYAVTDRGDYFEIATAYKGCEGIKTIFGVAQDYEWTALQSTLASEPASENNLLN
jgi:hypothetical protein